MITEVYARHPIVRVCERPSIDTQDIEQDLTVRDHMEKKNLAIFAIKHCARRTLPYGIWYCKGGREVVFNREYQPIAQRIDGVVSYADRGEWVKDIERSMMIYDDVTDPTNYLVKHLGYMSMDVVETRIARRALMESLKILKEFTPPESHSVHGRWSLLGFG